MRREANHRRQRGFSLVTAIFLLTVLAALAAFLVVMSGVTQQTPVLGLNGTQAYHAARSGLEWGIAGAINTDSTANCNGSPALPPYTVTVSCTASSHTDGGSTINVYVITAVAVRTGANPGELAYARRELRAVVSPDPPH